MTPIAEHLAVIDELRARVRGPYVAELRVGEDLWDADPADRHEAEEEFTAELDALAHVLSLRWGEPETVDLAGCLERSATGEPVRAPLDTLCGYVPELYTWSVDGRWLAVGVGWGAPDLPPRLVVALADRDPG